MKKLLSLVSIALMGLSFSALADGDKTIYKYGVPHKCDSETRVCIQDFFLTMEEELNKPNIGTLYLILDYKNKSRLAELHDKGSKYPMSVFMLNLPEDSTGKVRSVSFVFKADCQNLTLNPIAAIHYSGFFASGKQIHTESITYEWKDPGAPLLKFAVIQLCR